MVRKKESNQHPDPTLDHWNWHGSGTHLRRRSWLLAVTQGSPADKAGFGPLVGWTVARLDGREAHDGAAFAAICQRYARTYGRFGWSPCAAGAPAAPAYRLRAVDAMGRRSYEFLEFTPLEEPPPSPAPEVPSDAPLDLASLLAALLPAQAAGTAPAAVGRFVHVYVDRTTRRPVPIPEPIRAALVPLTGSAST